MERRRFLAGSAVVASVALAGCSDTDDGEDGGGGGPYDLDAPEGSAPRDGS